MKVVLLMLLALFANLASAALTAKVGGTSVGSFFVHTGSSDLVIDLEGFSTCVDLSTSVGIIGDCVDTDPFTATLTLTVPTDDVRYLDVELMDDTVPLEFTIAFTDSNNRVSATVVGAVHRSVADDQDVTFTAPVSHPAAASSPVAKIFSSPTAAFSDASDDTLAEVAVAVSGAVYTLTFSNVATSRFFVVVDDIYVAEVVPSGLFELATPTSVARSSSNVAATVTAFATAVPSLGSSSTTPTTTVTSVAVYTAAPTLTGDTWAFPDAAITYPGFSASVTISSTGDYTYTVLSAVPYDADILPELYLAIDSAAYLKLTVTGPRYVAPTVSPSALPRASQTAAPAYFVADAVNTAEPTATVAFYTIGTNKALGTSLSATVTGTVSTTYAAGELTFDFTAINVGVDAPTSFFAVVGDSDLQYIFEVEAVPLINELHITQADRVDIFKMNAATYAWTRDSSSDHYDNGAEVGIVVYDSTREALKITAKIGSDDYTLRASHFSHVAAEIEAITPDTAAPDFFIKDIFEKYTFTIEPGHVYDGADIVGYLHADGSADTLPIKTKYVAAAVEFFNLVTIDGSEVLQVTNLADTSNLPKTYIGVSITHPFSATDTPTPTALASGLSLVSSSFSGEQRLFCEFSEVSDLTVTTHKTVTGTDGSTTLIYYKELTYNIATVVTHARNTAFQLVLGGVNVPLSLSSPSNFALEPLKTTLSFLGFNKMFVPDETPAAGAGAEYLRITYECGSYEACQNLPVTPPTPVIEPSAGNTIGAGVRSLSNDFTSVYYDYPLDLASGPHATTEISVASGNNVQATKIVGIPYHATKLTDFATVDVADLIADPLNTLIAPGATLETNDAIELSYTTVPALTITDGATLNLATADPNSWIHFTASLESSVAFKGFVSKGSPVTVFESDNSYAFRQEKPEFYTASNFVKFGLVSSAAVTVVFGEDAFIHVVKEGTTATVVTHLVQALDTPVTTDAAPFYSNVLYDISKLEDGEYSIYVQSTEEFVDATGDKATLHIGRTPIVGVNSSNPPVYIGQFASSIAINSNLFPAGSKIALVSEDTHGFTLSGNVMGTATLTAIKPAVYGPKGDVVLRFSATTETGVVSYATLTIPVVAGPSAVASVYDVRGVVVGGNDRVAATRQPTNFVNPVYYLSYVVDFEVPVETLTKANIVCERDCAKTDCILGTIGGTAYTLASNTLTEDFLVITPSKNNKRFNITIPVEKSFLDFKGISFGLKDVTVVDSTTGTDVSVTVKVPTPTVIRSDLTLPVRQVATTSAPIGVVGVKYNYIIPSGIFTDAENSDIIVTATPASSFGLTFNSGKLGEASITGTPAAINAAGVRFTLTARDRAGNTAAATAEVVVVIQTPSRTYAVTGVPTSVLTFTEDGADISPFSGAAVSGVIVNNADQVYVRTTLSSTVEMASTEQLNDGTTTGFTVTKQFVGATADDNLSAAIQTYIRAIKYTNTDQAPLAGTRAIRIDVFHGPVATGVLMASVTRSVRLISVNDAPVVSRSTDSVTFDEGSSGVAVFPDAVITDLDDTELTSASFTIVDCSATRDSLYLPTDYAVSTAPLVEATFFPTTCTLNIVPIKPATRVTIAQMQDAVRAVKYVNLDKLNPTNFASTNVELVVKVSVQDNASKGRLADKKRSATSSANEVTVTIVPHDQAPKPNIEKLFGPGGVLYSSDIYSAIVPYVTNIHETYTNVDAKTTYLTRDTPVAVQSRPLTFPLPSRYVVNDADDVVDGPGPNPVLERTFNFQLPTTNGNWGAGQVVDPDSSTVGVAIEFLCGNTWTLLSSTPTTACGDIDSIKVDNGILTITVSASTKPGARKARLVLGTSPLITKVDFEIDFRVKACVDADADAASLTYFLARLKSADHAAFVSSTVAVTVLPDAVASDFLKFFYPANELCKYPVRAVSSTVDSELSYNGYATVGASFSVFDDALEALVGSPDYAARSYSLYAQARNAARGAYKFQFAAESFSLSSLPFKGVKILPSTRDKLPTPASGTIDLDVAVRATPAGTVFSKPVTFCIYAGDTFATDYKVLMVASQKDASDPSKGYQDWEPLFDQSFDRNTGLLCGKTTHFSVFAPIVRPIPLGLTVPKAHLMGGSCPNQCSGRGTCRQEGQCACFAGFEGYDCSKRTCPSSESWGEDQLVMHTQSECGGRGVCEQETGQCKCFDGYEGAACERSSCPNDCSGRGKCRMLGELANVPATYSSWETKRVQKCVCDGGFTGADCSQRICPFGDDPETVCNIDQRQVQQLTLFFAGPATSVEGDEIALIFQTASKNDFYTPMISAPFNGDASAEIANALNSLPEFAVTGVVVTKSASSVPNEVSVYDITFTGGTNTGNEALLKCPFTNGLLGCQSAGCRPKFTQLRNSEVDDSLSLVAISKTAILDGVENPSSTDFDHDVTLIFEVDTIGGVDFYSYQWARATVSGDIKDSSTDPSFPWGISTPIPPTELRTNIAGPYGLSFDILESADLSTIKGPGYNGRHTIDFSWSTADCKVEMVQKSADDFEKAECSNRGLCNRATGQCECFSGYNGYSCSQQTVYV